MLTNPNTVGLFDKNILEITKIVHEAGGLSYYDGANLNAVMGIARPGDMGFDVVHLNLHKTFSTPHGGGGPGSGPVGCKRLLDAVPACRPRRWTRAATDLHCRQPAEHRRGANRSTATSCVVVRALCLHAHAWARRACRRRPRTRCSTPTIMHEASQGRLRHGLSTSRCMHEFVMTLEHLEEATRASPRWISPKALLDYGIHPPTMYFPLIVHEALMVEPTETEARETLDHAIEVFRSHSTVQAEEHPEQMHELPLHTPVRRLDEVGAARNPRLRYTFLNHSVFPAGIPMIQSLHCLIGTSLNTLSQSGHQRNTSWIR